VKVRRIGCDSGKIYPPDGDGRKWWADLKRALGTTSSAFVDAALAHLQTAARLPDGPVSEIGMNAALAVIQAAAPQNEIEATLATQLAATHAAAMNVLGRVGSAHGGARNVALYSTAAAKLLRAYAIQIEALRRLRHGGSQHVRVEHVHVNHGGQAVHRQRRRQSERGGGHRSGMTSPFAETV
jgi:hypothetical protein